MPTSLPSLSGTDAGARFQINDCIGRGSYGEVFKGIDTETGKEVAFKVIELEDIEDDIESIYREISVLAGCQCKNITEYMAALVMPGTTQLTIVMELMACSVADLLDPKPLPEDIIAYILHEVLLGLEYLHREQRIHRDVKAANVLLNEAGAVKITDFGVSNQLTGTMGYRRRTFVGTPFCTPDLKGMAAVPSACRMAPEVIETTTQEQGYSTEADIWSLGITAFEMATGKPPHAELHPMRVLFMIPKSKAPELEGDFSPQLKDFVAKCLQKDPKSRPSARELLSHDFIVNAGQAPPALGAMAAEWARRRQPVRSRRDQYDDWGAQGGTLPAWDFGTRKFGHVTMKRGDTVRAAGMANDRMSGGTIGTGTVAARHVSAMQAFQHAAQQDPIPEETVPQPPSTTMTGTLPAGAMPNIPNKVQSASEPGGTVSAVTGANTISSTGGARAVQQALALGAGGGSRTLPSSLRGTPQGSLGGAPVTGTMKATGSVIGGVSVSGAVVSGRPTAGSIPGSDHTSRAGSEEPSMHVNKSPTAAGGPGAGRYAQQSSSEESSADPYSTVKVSDGGDGYGTVQSKASTMVPTAAQAFQAAAETAATTPTGNAADPGADPGRRVSSSLSIHIHEPHSSSPEPQRRSQVTPARQPDLRPLGRQAAAIVSESAAVLNHVMLPAIDTMCATAGSDAGPAAAAGLLQQQLLGGLRAHLQQIEKQCPGTCTSLLHEQLAQLAASSQPLLRPARAAAAALLAPGSAATSMNSSSDAMDFSGHQGTGTVSVQNHMHSNVRSDYAAAIASAARAKPPGKPPAAPAPADAQQVQQSGSSNMMSGTGGAADGPTFLPPRQIGALGSLGEFLLGKWQLENARERVFLARAGALGPNKP